MSDYIPYIIIGVALIGLEMLYFRLADRFNIIDKPNERSSHSTIVLRGGGIIFLFGAWLWSAFFGFLYLPIWCMVMECFLWFSVPLVPIGFDNAMLH